jgi:hypothetical protein
MGSAKNMFSGYVVNPKINALMVKVKDDGIIFLCCDVFPAMALHPLLPNYFTSSIWVQ